MASDETTPPAKPQLLTPLWIIALFLSLTEAVLGIAVTQTTGGIQVALTTFVILFPLLIAGGFFTVLWNRAYVFYSPQEFGGPVDVRQYVEVMRESLGYTVRKDEVVKIVEEMKRDDTPAEIVAQHIVERAIVDEREFRILRGLVGEDKGRSMHDYRRSSFYRPALDTLLAKGDIRFEGDKFFLTETGWKAARAHLLPLLQESNRTSKS